MGSARSSSRATGTGVQTTLEALLQLRADARGFSFLPRQPVTSLLAGRHASRLRGRGLAFEELRHYQHGDDIRVMDWRATARLRSPHVRVFSEERERPVLLIVDQRRTMFFGSRRAMKSVAAAEVAALAAWRALDAGDRVGGIVFNDEELVDLRPHRSQTRVLRLLHEVVRLNQALAEGRGAAGSDRSRSLESSMISPASGASRLNDALEAALRRATHDHLIVLISDLDGADEATTHHATLLAAHNDMLVVGIYDPLGASLRGQVGMVASDRGMHHRIPSGSGFAESFQQTFADLLEKWTETFRALRVPVLPISAAESPARQLRTLFGKRRSAR